MARAYEATTFRSTTETACVHLIVDETLKEGVKEIMGGKVLDFEAKRIRDAALTEGEAKGMAKGNAEGKAEGIVVGMDRAEMSIVRRLLDSKDYSVGQIAHIVGWTEEAVRALA